MNEYVRRVIHNSASWSGCRDGERSVVDAATWHNMMQLLHALVDGHPASVSRGAQILWRYLRRCRDDGAHQVLHEVVAAVAFISAKHERGLMWTANSVVEKMRVYNRGGRYVDANAILRRERRVCKVIGFVQPHTHIGLASMMLDHVLAPSGEVMRLALRSLRALHNAAVLEHSFMCEPAARGAMALVTVAIRMQAQVQTQIPRIDVGAIARFEEAYLAVGVPTSAKWLRLLSRLSEMSEKEHQRRSAEGERRARCDDSKRKRASDAGPATKRIMHERLHGMHR